LCHEFDKFSTKQNWVLSIREDRDSGSLRVSLSASLGMAAAAGHPSCGIIPLRLYQLLYLQWMPFYHPWIIGLPQWLREDIVLDIRWPQRIDEGQKNLVKWPRGF